MNTLTRVDCATPDAFELTLSREGARAAMHQLVAGLAALRASLQPDHWKAWCAALSTHPVLDLLLQDPYTRDARLKPAGYAGDARTLDYVYLRTAGHQRLTDLGRCLFDISTGIAIADAVRLRCELMSQHLEATLRQTGYVSAVSIACGHARELDVLSPASRNRLRFHGLDHDEHSISACRDRFPETGFNFVPGSVADALRGKTKLPPADIVYAAGLFDYLDDRVGAALVKRMFQALKPGGRMIVANLTSCSEEIAYMEAAMDWWMCYRDEAALASVAERAGLDSGENLLSTYTTSKGRVAWLMVERAG